jgi:hypothetical protein
MASASRIVRTMIRSSLNERGELSMSLGTGPRRPGLLMVVTYATNFSITLSHLPVFFSSNSTTSRTAPPPPGTLVT